MMTEKSEIIIGGDFFPTKNNEQSFINAQADVLIDWDILKILQNANLKIFNLEGPLYSYNDYPICKCGPNLKARNEVVNLYKIFKPLLLGLANNHILDYGTNALSNTIKILDSYGINYCGAGLNLQDASKTYIHEINGHVIGIYACAEHEFSIATDHSSGANPFDPLESLDHIVALKESCDYVIVLYHGGKEYYRYPSPELQKRCRKMIDKGADIVVCQHSHCIGCREDYKDGVIIYGQGNFLFDIGDNDYVNSGLLLKVHISNKLNVAEIPIIKNESGVLLANDEIASKIMAQYYYRSRKIKENGFIKDEYCKFAKKYVDYYLSAFLGRNILLRILNRCINRKLLSIFLNKRSYLMIFDYLECEAHQELFLAGIKNRMYK